MEPLKVNVYPDKVLRKKCILVDRVSEAEAALFERMFYAMHHYSGIGLAAPQIGISRSLIVADIGEGAIALANPVIVQTKGSGSMQEGCLSVPGIGVVVDRPEEIIVRGINNKGKTVEIEARGLLARVLQHEIDHLQGKLIIDYLNPLEKLKLKLRLRRGRHDAAV